MMEADAIVPEFGSIGRRRPCSGWRTPCVIILSLAFISGAAIANQVVPSDIGGVPVDPAFKANQAIYVTGDLDQSGGINEPLPIADIHLIPHQPPLSDGASIPADVSSGGPNTVTGTLLGGGFSAELIAGPRLPVGAFDLVIDEDQNGIFDAGYDLHERGQGAGALFVQDTMEPDVDLSAIKADAAQRAANADSARRGFHFTLQAIDLLGDVADAAELYVSSFEGPGAVITNLTVSAITDAYNDWVLDTGGAVYDSLSLALADNYRAIAADPPRGDFGTVTLLGNPDTANAHIQYTTPAATTPYYQACLDFLNRAQEKEAITRGLLAAIERFAGARNAAAREDALNQIKYQRRFIDLYMENSHETVTAIDRLIVRIQMQFPTEPAVDFQNVRAFHGRLEQTGLQQGERELFLNAGFDSNAIDTWRTDVLARWNDQKANDPSLDSATSVRFSDVLMAWKASIQSETPTWALYRDVELINLQNAIIQEAAVQAAAGIYNKTSIQALAGLRILSPTANAGGPYTGTQGVAVEFDASESRDPRGLPLFAAWDLDSDGIFDDLNSTIGEYTYTKPFNGYAACKVQNATGLYDVAYARVVIAPANRGPVIVSFTPEVAAVRLSVGQNQLFLATAADPDPGDFPVYRWLVDGLQRGFLSNYTYTPTLADVGVHHLDLVVSDASLHSPDARRQVRIEVTATLDTPTPSPTVGPSFTPTPTLEPTHTATNTPTETISPTPTRTGTVTRTPTQTPDFSLTPTFTPPPSPTPNGDFNGDRVVDEEDLIILLDWWHKNVKSEERRAKSEE